MPGLDRLPTLIAQIEQAGLPVQLAVAGERRRLPAGVELSAYRIVQEALTNSLKHAGPTEAHVLLGYHDEFLELRISDTGHNGDASAAKQECDAVPRGAAWLACKSGPRCSADRLLPAQRQIADLS